MTRLLVRALILSAALYFAFWPVPIDPVAWHPAPNPGRTGPYASNSRLRPVEVLPAGGDGPEDVALGSDGRLYTGLQDGRVVRLSPDGGPPETWVNTGGRPLGLGFLPDGRLLVADAFRGLLSISPARVTTVLATAADGERLLFPNDLDIARDGTVWFTDTSRRFDQRHWMLDFWEGRQTGRLLSYDPRTRIARTRLDGLAFANGVALGPDEAFILVSETLPARIRRFWLKGPQAGSTDIFLDRLPAYPDNLSYNGNGICWVALASPRVDALERLAAWPATRKALYRLPRPLRDPQPQPTGWVIGVNATGQVVENLQDASGAYGPVSSVNEYGGRLYLGSIGRSGVGVYRLPDRQPN